MSQFEVVLSVSWNKPSWLPKLDVWGAHLSGAGLKSWGADGWFKPLLLREKLKVLSSLLTVGHHCVGGGVYGETMSQPLLPASVWVFSHLPDV